MKTFTKENLFSTGYEIMYAESGRYNTPYSEWKFVARFKNGRGGAGSFMTHLRKNWTVEGYFSEMEAGKGPLDIVNETGYLLPHIKRWVKEAGYPVTKAGYEMYWAEQMRKAEARAAARMVAKKVA